MRLRPAVLSERQQIQDLIEQHTGTRDDIETTLTNLITDERHGLTVLVDSGRVIGCCGYLGTGEDIRQRLLLDRWRQHVDEQTALLLYGVVHANWQERGWGTKLVRRARSNAEQHNESVLGVAWCHSDRPNGTDVLRAAGIDEIDREDAYWGRHIEGTVTCPVCGDGCSCSAALHGTVAITEE